MLVVSSQDFRNTYEKFYSEIRKYLWPYDALKVLGDIEVDIFTSFIDMPKLSNDLTKLSSFIKETMKEDEDLNKQYYELVDMVAKAQEPDTMTYSRLGKVNEINPEKNKQIRTIPEEEEEDLI